MSSGPCHFSIERLTLLPEDFLSPQCIPMQDMIGYMFAVFLVAASIIAIQRATGVLQIVEGFEDTSYCGNILVQKGDKIVLKNTARAEVPGVNPLVFDNLEDYVEYMQWLRSQGVNCPVLYLREKYDAQNTCSYSLEPDPSDPSTFVPDVGQKKTGGVGKLVDAGHSGTVFNKNSYPGFDPKNQYIGKPTVLDNAYPSQNPNADAMTSNWGGASYSQQQVESGKYDEDFVYLPTEV